MPGTLRPSRSRGAAFVLLLYGSRVGGALLAILLLVAGVRGCSAFLARSDEAPADSTLASRDDQGNTNETAAPGTPPESTRPKSGAERLLDPAKKIGSGALKVVDKAEESWVSFNIPDNANYWVWIHIKNGNYETSRYRSAKGYSSFKKCLADVNLSIIHGMGTFSYDLINNTSTLRVGTFPTVTEEPRGTGQTLLGAVIESDPTKNAHRLSMLSDLIKAGADVNQRFGPDGNTALMLAASQGDFDLVECLVEKGQADRKLENIKGSAAADMTQSESIGRLLQ